MVQHNQFSQFQEAIEAQRAAPAPIEPGTARLVWRNPGRLTPLDRIRWDDLARSCESQSPFAQPWFLTHALGNCDPQGTVRLLVAEHDARVIGCAFARIEAAKPWLRHAHEAYMGLMFVEPAWRGRGVNAGLLCELQAWCRGRGIREVRLDVYADNIAAVSAYRKAGFRVNLLEMRMTLDDGSGRAGQ